MRQHDQRKTAEGTAAYYEKGFFPLHCRRIENFANDGLDGDRPAVDTQ